MSKKNLVIVESPAKAKTIEKFLGSDYSVKSSFGHIRDLPKKGLNIDKDNNFKPLYEIPDDKKKVVNELKKEAKTAEMVWLASDEDREGEAIAWHLTEALKLTPNKTKRIVFHEITESAIKSAIANPRAVDIDLVNAQQARRVLDRLVGYELSPLLWKKIQPGLSAGRVQSVAVRLIVDREREIRDFVSSSKYKVTAVFKHKNEEFTAELNKKLADEDIAGKFLKECQVATYKVTDIIEKPSISNPSAPFTTSTLQQEAARRLGFSVKQTMAQAQRLYESGHITYMRTDSTLLSSLAVSSALDYIKNTFGPQYANSRQYQTKNSSAQEAHEAIRPTNVNAINAGENSVQQKLYRLIWQRMIASQMAAAKTLKTEIDVAISNQKELMFVAKGEVMLFDGYLKVYGGNKDNLILPHLQSGDILNYLTIDARQTFGRPPARYSEASLVKTLEELGIGRPSTYAPTIGTIQSRGYIEKTDLEGLERTIINLKLNKDQLERFELKESYGADHNKLMPTYLAFVTTDFLVKNFGTIVESGFTASAELQLDQIAEGKLVWQDSIRTFYDQFHPLTVKAGDVSRQESTQTKLIGKDPKTSKSIYARFGRYGPMLQRGDVEDEKKPDFAPMPSGADIETVTLDQALAMFSLPRLVGKTADDQDITANIGRFGPYIQVGKLFVSIKPLDPFSISQEEAQDLYNNKLELNAKREIKLFEGSKIKILQGPYGPYATDGTKNARIPKSTKPNSLTLKQATDLLAKSKPAKKRNFKKKSSKK